MKTNVMKWGNSLAIRLPAPFTSTIGVNKGDRVDVTLHEDSILIKKTEMQLLSIVDRITEDNKHSELDYGQSQGKEIL